MINSAHEREERLLDLLSKQAVEGLGPGETSELRLLLREHPHVDPQQFELAAAAVSAAAAELDDAGPLPEGLAERIVASVQADTEDASDRARSADAGSSGRVVKGPAAWWRTAPPAWLAAAASLVIAFALWIRGPETVEVPVEVERVVEVAPPATPGPGVRRANLVEQDQTVIRRDWQTTDGLEGRIVEGDVVWSEALQEGYMRFRGLPPNDPSERQYQLWIFDGERDDRFPVDGGVFDVPHGTDEVIVPINANLPVKQPALFAVTVEPSGGVMVSSREDLVLIAPVDAPEDDG